MTSTTKVGIMTLLVTTLLVYLVFVIGDCSFKEKGYSFTISFYAVNGLSRGSRVSISGVNIGKVEDINIVDDQVYVLVSIQDKKYHIRRKNTFTISSAGLMGEKFVEIVPTRDYTSPYVAPGEVVPGTDPTRMEELFERGNALIHRLQEVTDAAKDLLGDPSIKENAKLLVQNAKDASANISEITASLKSKTDSIADNLVRLLDNLSTEIEGNKIAIKELIANFQDLSEKLNGMTGENRENIKEIVTSVKGAVSNLEKILEDLSKNNDMSGDIKKTAEALRKTAENTEEITAELKKTINDPEIRSKVSGTLKDVNKIASTADKIFTGFKETQFNFKYHLRYFEPTDDILSDINLDMLKSNDSFFRIGIEDIGNENDLTFMFGQKTNKPKLTSRAGILASKIALGADYQATDKILFSVDMIDTKDFDIRLTTDYKVDDHMNFKVRMDETLKDQNLSFGLEYTF